MNRKRRNRDKNQRQVAPSSPPEAQQQKLIRQQITASFAGPLPPPDILIQYNNAVPNAAERIITMAENQATHRMQLENRALSADILRSNLGVGAGLVVALSFLAGAVFLVYNGYQVAGSMLGSIDIGGLVGVFVFGTISRRNERRERVEMMTGQS